MAQSPESPPTDLASFATWISGQRQRLESWTGREIGTSGIIEAPNAKSSGEASDSDPSTAIVRVHPPTPAYLVLEEFLRLLNKLVDWEDRKRLLIEHKPEKMKYVSELLLFMEDVEQFVVAKPGDQTDATKKGKRSTSNGNARDLIESYFVQHHNPEGGHSVLNYDPMPGPSPLARKLVGKVSKASVSAFYKTHFGTYQEYQGCCNRGAPKIGEKLREFKGSDHAWGTADPSDLDIFEAE